MEKKISIGSGIKQLLSEYFVRVEFHPLVLRILHIVRFILLLIITVDWGQILDRNIQKLSVQSQEVLLGVILGCQIVGLGIIVWTVRKIIERMRRKKKGNGTEEGFIVRLVMSIGFYWVSLGRYVLMVPLMEICIGDVVQWVKLDEDLNVITESNKLQLFLSVINLTIFFLFSYPVSFSQFFNKSCISSKKSNIVSFTYILNSQSFLCLILPVIITTQNLLPESFTSNFIKLMGLLMFIILGYLHPSISLKNNGINEVGTIATIGLIGMRGLIGVVGKQIRNWGDFGMLVMGMILGGVVLYEMRLKRRRALLTVKNMQSDDLTLWDRSGYFQNLIYFIVNYKGHERQLLGYLFSGLQDAGKRTEEADSWYTQGKGSFMSSDERQVGTSIDSQIVHLKFKIIKILSRRVTDMSKPEQEVEQLFYQLIYLKFYSSYPLERLMGQSMGRQQLSKVVFDSNGIFQLMLQVMMLSRKNYLKSYLYVRRNEELLKKAGSGQWWSQVAGRCAAKIVQEQIMEQSITGDRDSLKGLGYYEFELSYEELNRLIVKSCQNNQEFWAQSLQNQPNQEKLEKLIINNSLLSCQIFKLSKQIVKQYPQESPLVLTQLMAAYSEFCLNETITDFSSRYNFLAVEYGKRRKEKSKKIGKNGLGRDKGEVKGSRYSLASNVGVLSVQCQSGKWNIVWANEYFWTRCYSSQQDSEKPQKKPQQSISILSLMLPEHQAFHRDHLTSFINQNQCLIPGHPSPTVLYKPQTKTFTNCILSFQLLPELVDGLKLLCFAEIQGTGQDDEALEMIIKKGGIVVGSTARLMKECRGFQEFDGQDTEEKGLERMAKSFQFAQSFKTNLVGIQMLRGNQNRRNSGRNIDKGLSSDVKQHTITFNHISYSIRLKNIITPSKSILTAFSFEELYHIALVPVNNDLKESSNPSKITDERSGVPQETINDRLMLSEGKKSMTLQESIPGRQSLGVIVNESEKIEEKQIEVIQVEKVFKSIFTKRAPFFILAWRIVTIVISLFLVACMLVNILFLSQRSQLLLTQQQMSKNFSCMISDIASTIITMREYNYYAYVYTPKHPQIPSLVKKLNKQENLISQKVKILAPELREEWRAFEVLPTGKVIEVYDSSYVVISNYMLSSITYLEQLPSTAVTFPILVGLQALTGKVPTPAHLSFVEGIYNGLYVTLPNLLKIRAAHLSRICEELLNYTSMHQLYSSFAGLFFILIFILVSLYIEIRSACILSQTSRLLSSSVLSPETKRERLDLVKEMKKKLEEDRKSQMIINQAQAKTNCLDYFTKTLKTIHIPADNTSKTLNQQPKDEYMTGRQLIQSSIQVSQQDNGSSQISKIKIQNKTTNKSEAFNVGKSAAFSPIELYPSSLRRRLSSFAFYLFVCLPLIGYFVGIVFGSLTINSNIVSHIRLTSQVYNRRSYQQLTFLLTRQTAYFEPFLKDLVPNWNNKMMQIIEGTYDTDRKVDKMLQDHQDSVNMIRVLGQINNGNLCDYVDRFVDKSEYFNITFTKSQCISVASSILTQGLKQAIVSYLQTSIQLFKKYPTPVKMTLPQRLTFIQKKQMKNMKYILAYVEQFMEMIIEGAEKDFSEQLKEMRTFAVVFSVMSVGCLIVLFYAIKNRWGRLIRERKEIQSMLGLTSLSKVKENGKLRDEFMKIGWGFFGA